MPEQTVSLRLDLNAEDLKREARASAKAFDEMAGDIQGAGGKIDAVMRGIVSSGSDVESTIRGVDQRMELLTGADREVFLRANIGHAEGAIRQIDQMLTDPSLTDTEIRIVMDKRNEATKAIEDLKGELDELGPAAADAGRDMERGLNLGALGGALGAAGAASVLDDAVTSSGRLRAQLGLTADEAREFDEIARKVYRNNFGETMGAAAQVTGLVHQALDLTGDALQVIVEDVFKVSDAFEELGADPMILIEDLRVMKDLWPGTDEAALLDMVTESFQRGTGGSGDLADSLQEYPGYFANIGLTAEDTFRILDLGMENNARNTDVVADSFKEMTLLMREDGSTAQEAVRSIFPPEEAERLIADFAAGGTAGRDAFYRIIEAVGAAGTEQERFNTIMAVFGDIGGESANVIDDMIPQLIAMKDETRNVGDATATLDAQYDGFRNTLDGMIRTLETSAVGKLGDVGVGFADVASNVGIAALGLKGLSDVLPGVDGRLGSIGKTAARAGAQFAILYTAGQILNATVNDLNRADLNSLQQSLLDIGDGAGVAGEAADVFGEDFGKLGDAIERVTAPSVITQADHAINTISTLGGALGRGKGDLEQARQTIDDLDQALAALAMTNAPAAAEALAALEGQLSPDAYAALIPLLDDYDSALAGVDVAARNAEDPLAALPDVITGVGDAAGFATDPMEDLDESIRGVTSALQGQFDPFFAAEDAMLRHRDAQEAVTEAEWALLDAWDERDRAVRDHGEGSREAMEAADNLNRAERDLEDANRAVTRSAVDVRTAQYELKRMMEEGGLSTEEAIGILAAWVDQGLITEDQARQTADGLGLMAWTAGVADGTDVNIAIGMTGYEQTIARLDDLARRAGTPLIFNASIRARERAVSPDFEYASGGPVGGPVPTGEFVLAP